MVKMRRSQRRMLELISSGHSGPRGKTLIEKMQDELDAELVKRADITDPKERLKNEGRIQGMLKMLSIMRTPSSVRNELELARARVLLKGDDSDGA